MNDDLFGPSPDTITSIPVPGGGPAPQSTLSTWDVTLSVLCLLVFLFAAFVLWRLRTLRKELRLLASQVVDGYKPPSSRFGLPKFGLRTLLVQITLAAVLLGTFGGELMRARRQARAIDQLNQAGKYGVDVEAAYQLGLLGDGKLAEKVCEWIHPHFGCRLRKLSLNTGDRRDFFPRETEEGQRLQGEVDLSSLGTLRDLQQLQLCHADLGTQTLQAIATLTNLRKISLIDCRLPDNAVEEFAGLPNLRSLQIRNCRVNDAALSGLEQMTELRELNLSENPLSDASAERIAPLEELITINLAGVPITGKLLAKFTTLENLQTIDLQRTDVDLEGLKHLCQIPSLRYVSLFGSKVGLALKPSEHKQAEAIFGEYSPVELHWHSVNNEGHWQVLDNRPGMFGNPFDF